MSKKVIKYFFELVYIFILPLVFMCATSKIEVEREFTYDNEGNYQVSEDTKKLSFDNSIIKYSNGYKNVIDNFNLFNGEYENGGINLSDGSLNNNSGLVRSKNYIKVSNNTYYLLGSVNTNNQGSAIIFYDNNYDFVQSYDDINKIPTTLSSGYIKFITIKNDNHNYNFNVSVSWANGNYVPYGDPLIIYSETDISGQNNTNYTIWGNIKNAFESGLDLNSDSLVLDLVFCYIILWFIMFLTWHLIYLLFDKLFHLRKE